MEEIRKRIISAIEIVKDGMPFRVGELYWGIDKEGFLNITGASQYVLIENVTKETCLKELRQIKRIFQEMVNTSAELQAFIKHKSIKYNLDLDYGMGDIRLCSEVEGVVKWETNLL